MRKNFDVHKEDRLKESTDSDRYNVDTFDLLNLRVSFSSDATSKHDKKHRSPSKSRLKPESFSKGDFHNHVPQRCQHYRNKVVAASGDSGAFAIRAVNSSVRRAVKNEGRRSRSAQRSECNDKSVHLLYSNHQRFPKSSITSPHYHQVVEHSRKTNSKTHTVDIHTVPQNMAHRSSRKKTLPKESNTDENGAFPFKITNSGNFKVDSSQVVFESEKLSVLVADPEHTRVNIHPNPSEAIKNKLQSNMNAVHEIPKSMQDSIIMGQNCFGGSLGSLIASTAPVRREKEAPEYEGKITEHILDPELNLNRLGYTASDPIDWNDVKLPEKTNLYLELYQRITNYTNADCKVYIDNEEFNCHLIVLQCYSEVFDEYVAVKMVELPSDKVSTGAFAFIYEWMITGEPAYTDLNRETVLEIFNASKYLKVKDLTEQCWAFIDNTDVFAEDTAFLLYMDAKQKDLDDVRELMLPRIQKFFLMLVSSQDWLDLPKTDVMNFLSSNYIRINCEMEVFMSAIRWLKHNWEEKQRDIYEIIGCVRFGNIAPWQLVDIKRNPENPEFLKLTSLPTICKLIDDGLSFVIIKYWYGRENDDFQHWNNILGLQEPPARNWSGLEKTYFTYREFLIYLDQYRRTQMIEKSKPKDKRRRRNSVDAETSPKQSAERVPPRIPTMDEFLSSRRGVGAGNQRKINKVTS